MISDIEDYFTKGCGRCARFETADCSVQHWAEGLAYLRALCLDLGLVETVKWGHPCYMHADRNIAVFGAFRQNFRLSFMNASLLTDPKAILQRAGPNARTPTMVTFQSLDDVIRLDATVRAYLSELMAFAQAGIKPPPRPHAAPDMPDELIDALDTDVDLAAAFHALTPGRQRGWCLHFNSAKQPATRINRIAKARDKILNGKGWNER